MADELTIPLKAKYRQPGRLVRRTGIDPPGGTWVFSRGLSSKRGRQGGNSGGVGGRRGKHSFARIRQRRKAI